MTSLDELCFKFGVPLQHQLDELVSLLPKGQKPFEGDNEDRRNYLKLLEVWFSQLKTCFGIEMKAQKLAGIDLHWARMMQINAAGTDFSSGIFERTAFTAAVLDECSFADANCEGADFSQGKLNRASFRRTRLRTATFLCASAEGADFYGADLRDADLSGSNFREANFRKIRISRRTNFRGCNLTGTILSGRGLEQKGMWHDVHAFYCRSLLRTLGENLRQKFSY